MPTIESRPGIIIIDTRRIPAQTVTGAVTKEGGKYFLQLKSRKLEIPLWPLAPEANLAAMVGNEVNVALTPAPRSSVIAIGTWPTPENPKPRRPRWIGCYIPVPDLRRQLDTNLQEVFLKTVQKFRVG